MKVQAIGVTRRFGTSSRTQSRYDMARLLVMTELRPSTNTNNTFQCSGFRETEYLLEPTAIDQFINIQYPAQLDVTTEARPSSNGAETYITGIVQK